MEDVKVLGLRLLTLRKTLSFSRKTMAQISGFSVSSIQRWEEGEKEISALKLVSYINSMRQYGIEVSLDALLDISSGNHLVKKQIQFQ